VRLVCVAADVAREGVLGQKGKNTIKGTLPWHHKFIFLSLLSRGAILDRGMEGDSSIFFPTPLELFIRRESRGACAVFMRARTAPHAPSRK
jgi:hypothetical protein